MASMYDPEAVRIRQRAAAKKRRFRAISTVLALILIVGNVVLFIFREPAMQWMRDTFGVFVIEVDKAP